MSDLQIFIRDKDNEGEWRDIDEGLLDLSSHDEKVRNKAIDDFAENMKELCEVGEISVFGWNRIVDGIAEQLKAGGKE